MIDWHTHILPGMDDGSQSVKESMTMLDMLSAQGVSTVIATPHYDANHETPKAFIARRDAAYDALIKALPNRQMRIGRGAEVQYYPGIERLEDLQDLCIDNSGVLLLEMPFAAWTEMMISEIIRISAFRRITVMLAHIERYLHLAPRGAWERLCSEGVLLQVNASFFISHTSRHRALKMLRQGLVQAIGSDCHNTSTRPPRMDVACEIISRKYGDEILTQLSEYGKALLG